MREGGGETDIQTDRQRGGGMTVKRIYMKREREGGGETERQKETERERDRQTDRQTERPRDNCFHASYYLPAVFSSITTNINWNSVLCSVLLLKLSTSQSE